MNIRYGCILGVFVAGALGASCGAGGSASNELPRERSQPFVQAQHLTDSNHPQVPIEERAELRRLLLLPRGLASAAWIETTSWEGITERARAMSGGGIPVAASLLLDDEEPLTVRSSAVSLLGHLKNDAGLPYIEYALRHSEISLRMAAARALKELGSDAAFELLASEISESNSDAAYVKAECLAAFGVRAFPHLERAFLARSNSSAARFAAKLGEIALPMLLDALENPTPEIRWTAVGALVELPSPKVVRAVWALIQDPNTDVRRAVRSALSMMGRVALVELAGVILEEEHYYRKYMAAIIIQDVSRLSKIKEPVAYEAVEKVFLSDMPRDSWHQSVRSECVFAMSALDYERAREAVFAATKHPNPAVRDAALLKVWNWFSTDKRTVDTVKSMLNDPDPEVRATAERGLRALKIDR